MAERYRPEGIVQGNQIFVGVGNPGTFENSQIDVGIHDAGPMEAPAAKMPQVTIPTRMGNDYQRYLRKLMGQPSRTSRPSARAIRGRTKGISVPNKYKGIRKH